MGATHNPLSSAAVAHRCFANQLVARLVLRKDALSARSRTKESVGVWFENGKAPEKAGEKSTPSEFGYQDCIPTHRREGLYPGILRTRPLCSLISQWNSSGLLIKNPGYLIGSNDDGPPVTCRLLPRTLFVP